MCGWGRGGTIVGDYVAHAHARLLVIGLERVVEVLVHVARVARVPAGAAARHGPADTEGGQTWLRSTCRAGTTARPPQGCCLRCYGGDSAYVASSMTEPSAPSMLYRKSNRPGRAGSELSTTPSQAPNVRVDRPSLWLRTADKLLVHADGEFHLLQMDARRRTRMGRGVGVGVGAGKRPDGGHDAAKTRRVRRGGGSGRGGRAHRLPDTLIVGREQHVDARTPRAQCLQIAAQRDPVAGQEDCRVDKNLRARGPAHRLRRPQTATSGRSSSMGANARGGTTGALAGETFQQRAGASTSTSAQATDG